MRKIINRNRPVLGIIWVVLIFAVTFSYAMFQGGFVSWFLFYSFIPVLLYTLAVIFYPLNDFSIERELNKERFHAGDTAEITLTVRRRIPFPLFYVVVEDRLPNRLIQFDDQYRMRHKGVFSLTFQRETSFTYELKDLPRGVYKTDEVTVKTGDLFGFVQKIVEIPVESEFIVYPEIQAINEWHPLELASGGERRAKQRFEYDLTSVSSIREYRPGDRLTWLDWKATARTNKLVTKEFEFPLNQDVMMVLDKTNDSEDPSGEAFERMLSLAASLIDHSMDMHLSLGLLSIGSESTYFSPESHTSGKWAMYTHLAKAERKGNGFPLYAFNRYLGQNTRQLTLVYVTTHLYQKLPGLFYDFMAKGFSIECFYVPASGTKGTQEELLRDLQAMGVTFHLVGTGRFDESMRAGDRRATS